MKNKVTITTEVVWEYIGYYPGNPSLYVRLHTCKELAGFDHKTIILDDEAKEIIDRLNEWIGKKIV